MFAMWNALSKMKRGKKETKHVAFEIVDERENVHSFSVDKKLLSSHSSVFKHLAKSGVLKKNKVVSLNNITFLGLQKILQYFETNEVTLENHKEAQETLKAALKYHLANVTDICIEYLITELDTSNVCEIYEMTETYKLYELEHACLQIIDREADAVIESSGFIKLKLSTLVAITKRSNLHLRSEYNLLKAIINWGKQEMTRRGVDSVPRTEVFIDVIAPALDNLRFKSMSNRKHNEPEVVETFKYILSNCATEQPMRRLMPRHYTEYYAHKLNILEYPQMVLTPGDSFNLKVEVLKGRVFVYGVSLALKVVSSASVSAACLYAVLIATNINTADKKVARETFFNVNNNAYLKFKRPLIVKESESFSLELIVQLTGKVSPLTRKNEVEVFFSPTQEVAMKIFPRKSSQKIIKCIFNELIYYF